MVELQREDRKSDFYTNRVDNIREEFYVRNILEILETAMEQAKGREDILLFRSTMNDYEHAINRTAEHGLVYADYYFIEGVNRLINLGLA
jgi:hypothetical protein